MTSSQTKLYDLIDSQDPRTILSEILYILSMMGMDEGHRERFMIVYEDIVRLFHGEYPGYRASNTRYHNLEHTTMVALAAARLIHGCSAKMPFDNDSMLSGLLAALYHDTGLIQEVGDHGGTGAKYTIGHEIRSIKFLRYHMGEKRFPSWQIDDCAVLVKCTDIHSSLSELVFRNDALRYMGMIVGSADLLSQIADRRYIEKLTLLFKEFEEAGIPEFYSEAALIEKTVDFYKNVARKRLEEGLGNISANMICHFKDRWCINRDLYEEAILNNIEYLKEIVSHCSGGETVCHRKYLRRGSIA